MLNPQQVQANYDAAQKMFLDGAFDLSANVIFGAVGCHFSDSQLAVMRVRSIKADRKNYGFDEAGKAHYQMCLDEARSGRKFSAIDDKAAGKPVANWE